MKTIIAGTQTFDDYRLLCEKMIGLDFPVTEVLSGGAVGADQLGQRWARHNKIKISKYLPVWTTLGIVAGISRNVAMAYQAEALCAFWDGKSTGTAHMISAARENGLIVKVFRYE